jgi:hypothetical protein
MKHTWKVSDNPTGRYRSFERRGWPTAEYENGDNAARIREDFVYKNLEKIASIVEAKGNYNTGKVISREINLAGLTGTLSFDFKDGSSFVVQNSVVWVENSYGTQFNRFPLTFHNVMMAGGKKMGRPSEQRMNEVFVKGRRIMTVQSVFASQSFDAPHLHTTAKCPFCATNVILRHIESFNSPVKVQIRCSHLTAMVRDDDDNTLLEFLG